MVCIRPKQVAGRQSGIQPSGKAAGLRQVRHPNHLGHRHRREAGQHRAAHVRHGPRNVHPGGRVCIVDENDIVCHTGGSSLARQAGTLQDQPEPAPREPALKLTADEALLFRFSALTYNAHRIHYDHNWVRQEGYADLVVHGPLQALMMGELIRRHGDGLVAKTFAYRLVAPMIGSQTFTVLAAAGWCERRRRGPRCARHRDRGQHRRPDRPGAGVR